MSEEAEDVQFIHCESKLFASLVSVSVPVASAVELMRYMPGVEGQVGVAELDVDAPLPSERMPKLFVSTPLKYRRVTVEMFAAAPMLAVTTDALNVVPACALAGAEMVEV